MKKPRPVKRVFEVRIDVAAASRSEAYTRWLHKMSEMRSSSFDDGLRSGIALVSYSGNEEHARQMVVSGQDEDDIDLIRVVHIHSKHPDFDLWREKIEMSFRDAVTAPPKRWSK
ncbi:hypothetical protein QTL95_01620 [Rhizobium sp. S152]|uniref:hypothetical protein n=1 Tax=Rhizobium sp. S152 TaxID=3055038 RepID=UPI0025A9B8EC|nr:hypothetical protein [Rhizobium sp. S152]MDM9624575.1 hypothetical protein [Rhizobium sp. S152]